MKIRDHVRKSRNHQLARALDEPGRPRPGCSASIPTSRTISSTVSIAAPGFARRIYCSTESRSRLAASVHSSCTLALPPLHHRLVSHELAGFGFLERLLHFADEP